MKFLLKISQAILAYLTFLHFVHLAIGFHKVSSNRSSQIDWTEVVVIAFFFWTGAGFKILEALILFSYKVMLGVYKQVSFYKMECPDGKKKT